MINKIDRLPDSHHTLIKRTIPSSKGKIELHTKPSIKKFLKFIAKQERTTLTAFMIESSLIRAKEVYREMKTTSSSIMYDENFNRIKTKPNEAQSK